MSASVEFSVQPFAGYSQLGKIRLTAPKSLNALSLSMIDAITLQLEQWANDPHIAAVWLEGEGDKGFCAGGNVVEVYRSLALQDQGAFSYEYFHSEYRLDQLLSSFAKPVICWGHGYVMGGGMGLFMASRYRVVTPTSRLAMPEITIGLYPDVGASYFLNQLPPAIARFLALTAFQVNAADATELGLASHYVANDAREAILQALAEGDIEAMSVERIETHIERVLYGYTMDDRLPLLTSELEVFKDELESLMAGDIHSITQAMQALASDNELLQRARDVFLQGSPLSACIILAQLERSQGLSLEQVFAQETILSVNVCLAGDFAEGVRALLIDKDRQPNWRFATVGDVTSEILNSFFVPPKKVAQIQAGRPL